MAVNVRFKQSIFLFRVRALLRKRLSTDWIFMNSMTWRKFKNAETRQIIKICSSHIIYCSVWQSRIKYIKQSGVEYIWLDCKFGSVSSSDQTEADHLKEPTRTETNEQNAKWMCDVLRRAANDTIQICNLIHLFFYVPNIP